MSGEKLAKGGVVFPIVEIDDNIVTFMIIPPQAEDAAKRREGAVLRGLPLRPVVGPGIPGGKVEDHQTLASAVIAEWDQETDDKVHGPACVDGMGDRLHEVMGDVEIIQERPEPTRFLVTMFLLNLTASEKFALEERGAQAAMLDIQTGSVFSKKDGSPLELRPAHADLLFLFAAVARGLGGSNIVEMEVEREESITS